MPRLVSHNAQYISHISHVSQVVKCRDSYHAENAFHNWCHAWSVTHVAYMLMSSCTIRRFLREEEVLSVMVACLVHDIHHPGVNSDYLIKSGSALALQFPCTCPQTSVYSCLYLQSAICVAMKCRAVYRSKRRGEDKHISGERCCKRTGHI